MKNKLIITLFSVLLTLSLYSQIEVPTIIEQKNNLEFPVLDSWNLKGGFVQGSDTTTFNSRRIQKGMVFNDTTLNKAFQWDGDSWSKYKLGLWEENGDTIYYMNNVCIGDSVTQSKMLLVKGKAAYDTVTDMGVNAADFAHKAYVDENIYQKDHTWYDDSELTRYKPTYPTYGGATLTVGTSGTYSTITDAYNAAASGDIIQILNDIDLTAESSSYLLLNSVKDVKIIGVNDRIRLFTNATDFAIRLRQVGKITFEDLVLESSGTYNFYPDAGNYVVGAELYLNNVLVRNTSIRGIINLAARTNNFNLICDSTAFVNSNDGTNLELKGKDGDIFYFNGCTFIQRANLHNLSVNSGNSILTYLYYSKLYQHSNFPVCRVGEDTNVPGVTDLFADIRNNTFILTEGAISHGLLVGRGTNDIKVINNKIVLKTTENNANIGLVIKTISTGDNALIAGNFIYAYRGIYLKGASNITVTTNSSVTTLAAMEIINVVEDVVLNCHNILVTNNNFNGASYTLLFNDEAGSEDINITKNTWTFKQNSYYSKSDVYIHAPSATYTHDERFNFWGNDNDLLMNWTFFRIVEPSLNKLKDVLFLTPRLTTPSTTTKGALYVNDTDNHLYYYNGITWVQLD